MSMVDSFLKKMKMDSEDDYDDDRYDDEDEYNDDEDFDDDFEPKTKKKAKKTSIFSRKKVEEDYDDDDFEDEEEEEEVPKNVKSTSSYRSTSSYSATPAASSKSNVVGMRTASSSGSSSQAPASRPVARGSEVCMIMPKSFEDANTIADVLLSHRAVVLNLEGIDMAAAQRIIDFASGACYTVGGNLQKISKKIFMIVPQDMNLSGDFDVKSMGDMVDLNQVNILK